MGFEPTVLLKSTLAFKTNALNHSAIYPKKIYYLFIQKKDIFLSNLFLSLDILILLITKLILKLKAFKSMSFMLFEKKKAPNKGNNGSYGQQ